VDAVIVLCVLVLAYFLPTIVASFRHRPNQGGIFIVNLLLGWSVIGWIVALVMACAANPPEPARSIEDDEWFDENVQTEPERPFADYYTRFSKRG
jgi:hypothetical protein